MEEWWRQHALFTYYICSNAVCKASNNVRLISYIPHLTVPHPHPYPHSRAPIHLNTPFIHSLTPSTPRAVSTSRILLHHPRLIWPPRPAIISPYSCIDRTLLSTSSVPSAPSPHPSITARRPSITTPELSTLTIFRGGPSIPA